MNVLMRIFAEIEKIDPDVDINMPAVSAEVILKNGLNIFYFMVGIVAVVMIIMAGFSYSTSGGDSAKVAKAKNTLMFSVVGLIIVAAAFAITGFILGGF